jgi:hypothetical protein
LYRSKCRENKIYVAVSSFLASILEAIEKKENQIGIFCDLTKSYDAINHDILLSKEFLRIWS